jgi:predicted nucleic acid-binding protein
VIVFLDSSALTKLLVLEPETQALRTFLEQADDLRPVASALVRTELRRAARRVAEELLPGVDRLVAGLALVPVDNALLDTAGMLAPTALRSLDAIHLASALRVAPLDAVVTYDTRMAEAVGLLGLPLAAPS